MSETLMLELPDFGQWSVNLDASSDHYIALYNGRFILLNDPKCAKSGLSINLTRPLALCPNTGQVQISDIYCNYFLVALKHVISLINIF